MSVISLSLDIIGGKEMWTWRSLEPQEFLQAEDQPSHIEKEKKEEKNLITCISTLFSVNGSTSLSAT